jgi:hypothetical protein
MDRIPVEIVDWSTVQKAVKKGREQAMPNWIGFGLTDWDTLTERGREFTYYALFCRAPYYKQLAEKMGLHAPPRGGGGRGPRNPSARGRDLKPRYLR